MLVRVCIHGGTWVLYDNISADQMDGIRFTHTRVWRVSVCLYTRKSVVMTSHVDTMACVRVCVCCFAQQFTTWWCCYLGAWVIRLIVRSINRRSANFPLPLSAGPSEIMRIIPLTRTGEARACTHAHTHYANRNCDDAAAVRRLISIV